MNEFPDLSSLKNSQDYKNQNEIKFANNDFENFPDKIKNFFNFLNSETFLNFLQILTSINEKLIADKELNGGGLHEIKTGGLLKVHTDFSKHPTNNFNRRVFKSFYLFHLNFQKFLLKNKLSIYFQDAYFYQAVFFLYLFDC